MNATNRIFGANSPVGLSSHRFLQQYLFSLLESCKTTRALLQIHAQIVVNGFSQKNYIIGRLLSLCIASDNLVHAHKTFELIENPSTIIWNQVIRGYARSESPQLSIQLYNRMVEAEAEPNGFTFSFILTACAKQFFLREGEQLHGRILSNGLSSDVFVQTSLVNMYGMAGGKNAGVAKARKVFDEMTERSNATWNSMLATNLRCGYVDEARKIFDEMPERNTVSWTTMIAGCAQNGKSKQALALFREMLRARVEVDEVTMLTTLTACAELGDLTTGKWIHSWMDTTLQVQDQPQLLPLNNALIHMYASCGVIEEAYKFFKKMRRRSVVSWTTMITGFAKQGYGEEAIGVFRWMQNGGAEGAKPDEITFLGVLCACSHQGMVDEARHYFNYMIQSCGIEPRIEHYGCMVDVLSRAGQLEEANNLIETMPMRPNDIVWGALLGGCRIYKKVELANHVVQQLKMELEPDRAAGYLVLLSNVYAAVKRWVDVAHVRQRLADLGVKKPPGRSWIQVNGVIHDFVAGDLTHRHTFEIYEMVDGITRMGKWENYVLDPLEVLLNVDGE